MVTGVWPVGPVIGPRTSGGAVVAALLRYWVDPAYTRTRRAPLGNSSIPPRWRFRRFDPEATRQL
jgi:hypothetical protein